MVGHESAHETNEQHLPPVWELGLITMILVVTGGIFLAAHMPKHVPLLLPIVLLVVAACLLVVNVFMLARTRDFAWDYFFLVGRWSLGGYAVIAGMIEYAFLRNHMPHDVLAVLTGSLLIFAVDIPLMFAFSVARYQPAGRHRV
jgi:hypothetical protein